MTDSLDNQTTDLVDLAGDIVSAYVSNNSTPASELPGLIQSVHAALTRLASGLVETAPEEIHEKPTPAQIRKSVTPGGIVSFLDGRTYKTLKRHLTGHGLDPHTYRQRYGLPADYPMVAPDYAARRSALAKSIGLGRVGDSSENAQPQAKGRGKAA
ncbi:MAG: MucR family transcriptional regulator [Phreatobacter sp.]|nr:MucR family transcriptional regulator [Phreatobacter sp.]